MQYQHSSNFMNALPLVKSMARTSRGQTSTHTVHPLWAIHLSSSIRTGTLVILKAVGMIDPLCGDGFGFVSRRLVDTQPLICGAFAFIQRYDIRLHRPLETSHSALLLLELH